MLDDIQGDLQGNRTGISDRFKIYLQWMRRNLIKRQNPVAFCKSFAAQEVTVFSSKELYDLETCSAINILYHLVRNSTGLLLPLRLEKKLDDAAREQWALSTSKDMKSLSFSKGYTGK